MKLMLVEGTSHKLYSFFCPGCGYDHYFTVRSDGIHPSWTFDGNLELPTFTPSLRVLGGNDQTTCHLFVIAGKIHYCDDSPHHLAGKIVDMKDIEDEDFSDAGK